MNNPSVKKNKSVRSVAAKAICRVAYRGDSLQTIQAEVIPTIEENSRALAYEMIWGTIRHFHALETITVQLLSKPLAKKHHDVQSLLLLGIYQLSEMNIPEYAAVSETVSAADDLKKSWARKLINGCLRTFLRQKDLFLADLKNTSTLPKWLNQQLKHDWPEQKQAIESALNHPANLTLRVNTKLTNRDKYQLKLNDNGIKSSASKLIDSAIILDKNHPVQSLPNFTDGELSIQSESAQLVAKLVMDLNHQQAPIILDACSAPGGKACHLLEAIPDAQLDCIEISESRTTRIEENFSRLNLSANIYVNDASKPETWSWLSDSDSDSDEHYDFILIDAPCSGTGVISKHPDIKIHRTEKDLIELTKLQSKLLNNLWPLVKKGGYLIYLTCSILKSENEQQIKKFISQCKNAQVVDLDSSYGLESSKGNQPLGRQRLPLFYDSPEDFYKVNTLDNMDNVSEKAIKTNIFDGFYYCAIKKI